jgi:hypothetical protein
MPVLLAPLACEPDGNLPCLRARIYDVHLIVAWAPTQQFGQAKLGEVVAAERVALGIGAHLAIE